MTKHELTQLVCQTAKIFDADLVAIGGAERFQGTTAMEIFPGLKSVVCIAYRVLRGSRRGIEEGSTYYQYSTTGVETIDETMMPQTLLRVSAVLEDAGYTAIPQRRHQTITTDPTDTNPEVNYEEIYRGNQVEKLMNFEQAAVLCGLGEMGLSGTVLSDEFGPFQRYAFILTDAELEETPLYQRHLCDGCRECVKACPGRALSDSGELNRWQCAVYYNGANGTKNPFMPPEAFDGMDDRIAIIAGEAKVTPETAKKILDKI